MAAELPEVREPIVAGAGGGGPPLTTGATAFDQLAPEFV